MRYISFNKFLKYINVCIINDSVQAARARSKTYGNCYGLLHLFCRGNGARVRV